MIIDVTRPDRPVEKFHIPVAVAGGQSQSVRMCLGSICPTAFRAMSGAGLDILKITGKARRAAFPNEHSHDDDD